MPHWGEHRHNSDTKNMIAQSMEVKHSNYYCQVMKHTIWTKSNAIWLLVWWQNLKSYSQVCLSFWHLRCDARQYSSTTPVRHTSESPGYRDHPICSFVSVSQMAPYSPLSALLWPEPYGPWGEDLSKFDLPSHWLMFSLLFPLVFHWEHFYSDSSSLKL